MKRLNSGALTAALLVFVWTAVAAEETCRSNYQMPPPSQVQHKVGDPRPRAPLAHLDDPRCEAQPNAGLDRLAAYHCAQLYDAASRLEEALGWYSVAAEAGYGPAQKRLGNLYGGEGEVERDYARAVYWQRRARESGESIDLPHVFMGSAPP